MLADDRRQLQVLQCVTAETCKKLQYTLCENVKSLFKINTKSFILIVLHWHQRLTLNIFFKKVVRLLHLRYQLPFSGLISEFRSSHLKELDLRNNHPRDLGKGLLQLGQFQLLCSVCYGYQGTVSCSVLNLPVIAENQCCFSLLCVCGLDNYVHVLFMYFCLQYGQSRRVQRKTMVSQM